MDTNSESRDVAERASSRLLELRANLSPSIADVAAIASEVRVPSGSELSSHPTANKARAEAWLSIRKVVRTLEGNPSAKNLDVLWARAIDQTKNWLQAIDG